MFRLAPEGMDKLQWELGLVSSTAVQSARRFYNTMVRDYETAIQTFPSNMIAKMFGFAGRDFFELPIDSKEAEPVQVSFTK